MTYSVMVGNGNANRYTATVIGWPTCVALRTAKIRVGTQDLRIAAIVLSINRTLITRNHRDFAQVPGLKIEDWT